MTANIIQKGKLLVSDISLMLDASFSRSVILITEHTPLGITGFILNKPSENILVNEAVPELMYDVPIYEGGPVEENSLFFIHNIPELIPNSDEIADGLYFAGDFNVVIELAEQGKLSKKNIRFFAGYTGWGANQLETEIRKKSWVVFDNKHKDRILCKSSSKLWKKHIESLGEKYLIWSNAPEDPCDN